MLNGRESVFRISFVMRNTQRNQMLSLRLARISVAYLSYIICIMNTTENLANSAIINNKYHLYPASWLSFTVLLRFSAVRQEFGSTFSRKCSIFWLLSAVLYLPDKFFYQTSSVRHGVDWKKKWTWMWIGILHTSHLWYRSRHERSVKAVEIYQLSKLHK
jgi:hypothetical protein